MKILLLNYEFPPLGGGAGRATYNLARQLARDGHQVDVLTSKSPGDPYEERVEGFMVYRVRSLRKGIHECGLLGAFSFVLYGLPPFLKLTQNQDYDLLHYFFGLPTAFLTLLPGKHRRIPYVLSLRGSDVPGYDPYNLKLALFHQLLKPLTRRIWNRARTVAALSHSLRRTALETVPECSMAVIPNGIDTRLFSPPVKRPPSNGDLRLITVCRLLERKGIQHLLQALSEMHDPSVRLLIVGTGNYEESLKSLCVKLGLNGSVNFFGYCPSENLRELYGRHDVFVLPSLAESFGLVFLEAMACGLPVIGTKIGGIPDIVQAENGILVEPGDIPAIGTAIRRMKDYVSSRKEMATRNRQRVLDHFTWKMVMEDYLRIYQMVRN